MKVRRETFTASVMSSTRTFSSPCSTASRMAASARACLVASFFRSRRPGASLLSMSLTLDQTCAMRKITQ